MKTRPPSKLVDLADRPNDSNKFVKGTPAALNRVLADWVVLGKAG
ncbi:hypothetical protein UF75_4948 [Desulfosporosinus sp. I2]|nr:hypothetical protein [Desulfosporosinus sp. I2]KJR44681.1 hypothetical protein UF75_4948 [Desulfosporosinus sp. I2]